MFNLPTQKEYLIGPIVLSLVAVLIAVFDFNDLLAYHREYISQGQYWRILSGHITHSNINHLLLNAAGIWLIWALYGEYVKIQEYTIIIVLSSLYISGGMYIFTPSSEVYYGLSGVLHSVIVVCALKDISQGRKTGVLILVGVGLKIAYEQFFGADPAIAKLIDARVSTESHLFGVVSGLFVYAKLYLGKQVT